MPVEIHVYLYCFFFMEYTVNYSRNIIASSEKI